MEPREKFGVNLRKIRKRAGLSQEALGHASGLHSTEVGRLERATRDPRLGTLVKLARALDTTPAELLQGIK
jgi:transcriptional regulator with XRE-family HTH domain